MHSAPTALHAHSRGLAHTRTARACSLSAVNTRFDLRPRFCRHTSGTHENRVIVNRCGLTSCVREPLSAQDGAAASKQLQFCSRGVRFINVASELPSMQRMLNTHKHDTILHQIRLPRLISPERLFYSAIAEQVMFTELSNCIPPESKPEKRKITITGQTSTSQRQKTTSQLLTENP